MRARRDPHAEGEPYVRLQMGKGVYLLFTLDEYVRGLNRAKMERRALRRQQHAARRQARTEAQTLAWLDDQEGG
jgi:hypothetical protein